MSSYLYYKRGDEWVRVTADRFATETVAGSGPQQIIGGQCRVIYTMSIRRISKTSPNPPIETFFIEGPISEVIGPYFQEGSTFARLHAIYGNGAFRIGSTNEKIDNPVTFQIISIVRRDGLPDNCGNSPAPPSQCNTKFYLNNVLVLTLTTCPEITDGRGCEDCCSEVLPIIRSIRI